MKKHWNKILALFMGVLMLLAILPIGVRAASAEDGDNEIVIPDYDPNNHNHMHDHDHEHDHEHEHEHEHAHDHEHEHEHEDPNAHRNPHEAARKNEQNPNLQTQQNAHKYPDKVEDLNAHRNPHENEQTGKKLEKNDGRDKVEDLNAHRNPHENKQPEQDQKRQPVERAHHEVGEPFVLTDGITLTPNSEDGDDGDDECPHENTEWGNFISSRYEYVPDGNWGHFVYYYETHEVVCSDCGEVVGPAEDLWDSYWEEHTYQNGMCTLCGYENTCTHDDTYASYYWAPYSSETDFTYEEIPNDNRNHYITGMIVYYTACRNCPERLFEQEPVLGTEQGDHSYYAIWDEEAGDYINTGKCKDCGHVCTHTNMYDDWDWVDGPHYEEIEGDHRYHNAVGTAVTYMYCPDCGMSFDDSEPTPRTETYSHSYENESDNPLVCKACNHNRAVYGDALSVGDSTFDITSEGAIVLRSFTPETTGTYVFIAYDDEDTYGYIFDSDLEVLSRDDDAGGGMNFRVECELIAGETYWFSAKYYGDDRTGSIPVRVIDAASCPHTNAYEDWYWVGETHYEEIEGDHRYHKEIGNVVTYMYCPDCGTSFDESEPTTRTETYSHDYDNYESPLECYRCHHRRDVDGGPASVGDNTFIIANPSEVVLRSFTPETTGTYVFYSRNCQDIFGFIFDSDLVLYAVDRSSEANGWDFRIECELTAGETYWLGACYGWEEYTDWIETRIVNITDCLHENKSTSLDWVDSAYEEIDNNYHYKIGTAVEYTYCADCGALLDTSEPMQRKEQYWHSYRNGTCVDCGHVCTHTSTYTWSDIYNAEYREIEGDDRYHYVTCTREDNVYCEGCSMLVSPGEPYEYSGEYSHSYSNGKCEDCGHVCSHTDMNTWSEWEERNCTEIEGDNQYHNVTGTKADVTVCEDCWTWFDRSEPYEASEKEWHDYDSDGKCVDCGHQNTCEHLNAYSYSYWSGGAHYEEIEGDNRYHNVTGTMVDVTYCDDCGEQLYGSEPYEASGTDSHDYNSDGKCRQCGHQNTCEHENTYSYSSWLNGTFTEIEGDDRYHDATGTIVDYTRCVDCWMTIDRSEPYEVSGQFEHDYSNGVCWRCGHVCPHEDAYTDVAWVDVTYTEIEGNNKYHYAEGLKQELTRCSCCYKVLERGEPFEVSGEEYHGYNSKTQTCYSCGHVNTCEHKNRAENGWWYEMPKYEDWGSKQHMARGKAVFYSYCADCEAWYTEIVDNDPNEHSQKYDHVYDENGVCYYCGRKDLSFKTQPKSQTVANGKTAKFSVASKESGAKYQWYYSKDNGVKWTKMKGNTGTSISVKASATTNGYLYRCIVTANGGKASSNIAKLTVSGVKPKITQQPKKMTVNCGNNAKFSVVAAGTGLSYQWYYSKDNGAKWTKWSGKTSASVSIKSTAKNNGTLYRCVVKNSKGSVTSSSAMMTVDGVKPRILTQPKAVTVASGKTATFKVVAAGVGLKYQWYYSKDNGATWKKYSGKTSATLKVKGSATTNGYLYRCEITNDTGSVTSKAVKLTVSNVKPKIIVQPAAASAKSGKTATFKVVAAGVGLKYQWQYSKNAGKTWTNLSGKTSATFSVKVSKSNNGYLYRCVVKNTKGSVNSSAAKLTLKK